jgi:hypothetical protein
MASSIVETIRCRKKFVDGGYQYLFDKASADGTKYFWRCDKRQLACKARLHTSSSTQQVLRRMHDHNHDSDAAAVQVDAVRTAIKRRAVTTVEVR